MPTSSVQAPGSVTTAYAPRVVKPVAANATRALSLGQLAAQAARDEMHLYSAQGSVAQAASELASDEQATDVWATDAWATDAWASDAWASDPAAFKTWDASSLAAWATEPCALYKCISSRAA